MTESPKFKFVDIHSHFLYGVDDGAASPLASIDMLDMARRVGTTHLLATPHATDLTNGEVVQQFVDHFSHIQQAAQKDYPELRLGLAAELFFSSKIYDWLQHPWSTFNNNRKYLLFELPLFELPKHVHDFIFQCKLEGISPILAHPERYGYLHHRAEVLLDWHHQGCLMQTNAGSITGQFGTRVQKMANKLIRAGLIQFIASDAHDTMHRNYLQLIEARNALSIEYSASYLDDLFYHHPLSAFEGRPVTVDEVNEQALTEGWDSLNGWAQKLRKVFHL